MFLSKRRCKTVLLGAVAWMTLIGRSPTVHAISDTEWREAAQSKEWHRIMHYIPGLWGGVESRIDGPAYFFAPDGKINPEAELRASFAALTAKNPVKIGKLKQPAPCAMPYRTRWIEQRFGLPALSRSASNPGEEKIACPDLDDYVSRFQAKSVSLVFSSAYPNNPGSMFGHTFLKFTSGVRSELLDQAISYAANIGQDAGLMYMARGIFGGYLGAFSLTPYYVKVNEYNHSESRDLWEYELSLSPEEVRSLILHLWEIESNAWFDYYFFDENCALILMAAIEAVRPSWTLSDFRLYTIPSETTKHLERYPDAIRDVRFRPSMRKKFLQAQAALSDAERLQLAKVREGKFDDDAQIGAPVLDTAALYFQYVKQRDGKDLSPQIITWQKEALLRRSRLKNVKGIESYALPDFDRGNRPNLGHHPKRLLIGGGSTGDADAAHAQTFFDLGFRFAYHDLLNFDDGYERFSHFEFPGGVLRYYGRDHKLAIENITPVAITSLFAWSELERRVSWKILLDYRSPKDFGCQTCHTVRTDIGAGVTIAALSDRGSDRWLVSFLGGLQPEVGSSLDGTLRIGPKAELATLGNITRHLKLRLASSVTGDFFQSARSAFFIENRADLAWSITQNTELRADALHIPPTQKMTLGHLESRLALHLFF